MSLKTSNNLENNIVCLTNFFKLYLLVCRAKNGNFSLTGNEAVCNYLTRKIQWPCIHTIFLVKKLLNNASCQFLL